MQQWLPGPAVSAWRRKMRMKLNKSSQLVLVSAASLIGAGLITSCATLTVDFVYITSSKAAGANNYGEVDVMEVNSESGRLRKIPTSPFPSGGRDPVAEAVGSNYANLYVVNEDDNNIVQFAIGNDGKLYPQNTVNTPGVFPMAVAVHGSRLFVLDTYQPLPSCSPAEPCSGSIAVFPLSSTGQPGAAVGNPSGNINYWPLTLPCSATDVLTPTAINVLSSGSLLYVTVYDATAAANNASAEPVSSGCDTAGKGTSPTGYLFAYSVGSDGVLSALKGSPLVVAANGASGVGVNPNAIASDPGGQYAWITDFANGVVYGYAVTSGLPKELSGKPFATGSQPAAITVDPTGSYAYVANSLDNTITAYTIDAGTLTSFGTFATTTQPVAVLVDPSTGNFVYAAGYLGASAAGFELIPGNPPTLYVTQQAPYATDAQPTAMAAIPHGTTTTK